MPRLLDQMILPSRLAPESDGDTQVVTSETTTRTLSATWTRRQKGEGGGHQQRLRPTQPPAH